MRTDLERLAAVEDRSLGSIVRRALRGVLSDRSSANPYATSQDVRELVGAARDLVKTWRQGDGLMASRYRRLEVACDVIDETTQT
jgi:hypothetical protein